MEVKPRTLVLVLLVVGVLLAGIFRFGAAERAQQGPSLLRVDQQGDLYVVFNEKIFRLASNGVHENTYELQDLGVGELIGGMAFFRNGDLLLRTGNSVPNWYEQILIQLRVRQAERSTGVPGDRLARCNLVTLKCIPLKGFEQTFKRTFRIDIDADDNIFIADTGREALYWLDPEGHKLAEIGSGFRLPNQLVRNGGRIVVTNTNCTELTFIPLEGGAFAPEAEWSHLKVNVPEAKHTGEIWPMDLLRAGADWLALSQGPNMMFGDVFRFSEDGRYQARFGFRKEVDPVALAMLGSDVVVADYAGLRLLRFSERGEPRGELIVPEIASYADEVRAARARHARYQTILWALFAAALAAGFAVAIAGEVRRRRDRPPAEAAKGSQTTGRLPQHSERPAPADADIHWIGLGKSFQKQIKLLIALTLVVGLAVLSIIASRFDEVTAGLEAGFALLVLFASLLTLLLLPIGMLLMFRKFVRNLPVGVVREWVVLHDLSKKVAIGHGSDVGVAPNAIVIDDVSVPTGGRKLPMFDREEWARWVEPRLAHARRLNGLDMLLWSWRYQRTLTLLAIAALVLSLVALVFLR